MKRAKSRLSTVTVSNVKGVTSERAQAYGRVVATLNGIGPTKLSAEEQSTIRDAADALFFGEDLPSDDSALVSVYELLDGLVSSGRWLEETAGRLRSDLRGCGPRPEPLGPGRHAQRTPTRSTTKTSVSSGAITPPAPRLP